MGAIVESINKVFHHDTGKVLMPRVEIEQLLGTNERPGALAQFVTWIETGTEEVPGTPTGLKGRAWRTLFQILFCLAGEDTVDSIHQGIRRELFEELAEQDRIKEAQPVGPTEEHSLLIIR